MTDPYTLRLSAVPRPNGGPEGLAWWANLKLAWFRGVPFSCLERVDVSVGGRAIAPSDLAVRFDGRIMSLDDLRATGRYWGVQDNLQVGVPADSGAPAAGTLIEVEVVLRMPDGAGPHGDWPRHVVRGSASFGTRAGSSRRLGLCSFSFAGELRRGRALRACLNEVGAMGGFAGVDILGAQAVEGYPNPSVETLDRLGGMVRDSGLVPLVYSAYTDPGRRLEPADDDDLLGWATEGLDVAAALGCAFARINLPARRAVYERIADLAQQRGLVLLTELHAMTSTDPYASDMLGILEDLDTPHLGLTLDLSCVMHALPVGFVDNMLRSALPEEAVQIIVDGWDSNEPEATSLERLARLGAAVADSAGPLLRRSRRLFRHSRPDWLPDVLTRTRVVHGKFFDVQHGVDASVPTAEIFDQFDRAGFDGHILAEFEGHLWTENPDTFEQLRRYRDLVQNLAHA